MRRRSRRRHRAHWGYQLALDGVRGVGAVADVYNWVKISGDTSYTGLFDGSAGLTSPPEHYWSLAIEEQFYLLRPFVMLGLLRAATRSDIDAAVFVRRLLGSDEDRRGILNLGGVQVSVRRAERADGCWSGGFVAPLEVDGGVRER